MEHTATPFLNLNLVLQVLGERVKTILSANFVGAYVQGSFAVGDFDAHSDVDFVIVIRDALTDDEVQALQAMHAQVYAFETEWAKHLEGSYFPQRVLRQLPQHNPRWFLDHGSSSLIPSDHCDTLVVRWVLREHGITLDGPAPITLIDPISVTALRQEILAKMRSWGQDILTHPDQYNNRFYQAYIVLNYCRMLHDLQNGFPGSKLAGAEWAKAHLDPSWVGLIDRTWAGRPNPALSVRQPADLTDFQATLEFVRYIVNEGGLYARATQLE
jgi:predicted nucleotidyltransferase